MVGEVLQPRGGTRLGSLIKENVSLLKQLLGSDFDFDTSAFDDSFEHGDTRVRGADESPIQGLNPLLSRSTDDHVSSPVFDALMDFAKDSMRKSSNGQQPQQHTPSESTSSEEDAKVFENGATARLQAELDNKSKEISFYKDQNRILIAKLTADGSPLKKVQLREQGEEGGSGSEQRTSPSPREMEEMQQKLGEMTEANAKLVAQVEGLSKKLNTSLKATDESHALRTLRAERDSLLLECEMLRTHQETMMTGEGEEALKPSSSTSHKEKTERPIASGGHGHPEVERLEHLCSALGQRVIFAEEGKKLAERQMFHFQQQLVHEEEKRSALAAQLGEVNFHSILKEQLAEPLEMESNATPQERSVYITNLITKHEAAMETLVKKEAKLREEVEAKELVASEFFEAHDLGDFPNARRNKEEGDAGLKNILDKLTEEDRKKATDGDVEHKGEEKKKVRLGSVVEFQEEGVAVEPAGSGDGTGIVADVDKSAAGGEEPAPSKAEMKAKKASSRPHKTRRNAMTLDEIDARIADIQKRRQKVLLSLMAEDTLMVAREEMEEAELRRTRAHMLRKERGGLKEKKGG